MEQRCRTCGAPVTNRKCVYCKTVNKREKMKHERQQSKGWQDAILILVGVVVVAVVTFFVVMGLLAGEDEEQENVASGLCVINYITIRDIVFLPYRLIAEDVWPECLLALSVRVASEPFELAFLDETSRTFIEVEISNLSLHTRPILLDISESQLVSFPEIGEILTMKGYIDGVIFPDIPESSTHELILRTPSLDRYGIHGNAHGYGYLMVQFVEFVELEPKMLEIAYGPVYLSRLDTYEIEFIKAELTMGLLYPQAEMELAVLVHFHYDTLEAHFAASVYELFFYQNGIRLLSAYATLMPESLFIATYQPFNGHFEPGDGGVGLHRLIGLVDTTSPITVVGYDDDFNVRFQHDIPISLAEWMEER